MKTLKQIALAGLIAGSALFASAAVSSAQAEEWGGYGGCRSGGWGGGGAGWGGPSWGGYRGHDYVGSYAKEHGMKFSHGYFYAGKVQKHFTEKWYDPRFKTELYWDEHARSAYYWCEGHGVYYPIRYIGEVAPDAKGPGPVVAGSPAGGPEGAVAAPLGGTPVGGTPVGGGAVGGGAAPPAAGGQPAVGTPSGAANVKPQQGGTPVQPVSVTTSPAGSSGQAAVAPTQAQRIPAGTFDDAIPGDLN